MEKIKSKPKQKNLNSTQFSYSKDRKEFLKLSLSERSKILKRQAEDILNHYNEDQEWREFQALDIYEH